MDEPQVPQNPVVPPQEPTISKQQPNKKRIEIFIGGFVVLFIFSFFVFSIFMKQTSVKKTEQPSQLQISESPKLGIADIETPANEKVVSVSKLFSSSWSSASSRMIVSEGQNKVGDVLLSERPLAVWFDTSSKYLIVITASNGTVENPHNLYIVKDNILRKVLQGKTVKMGEGFPSNDHLYDYWDFSTEDEVTERIEKAISISPDDKYLLTEWLQYEHLSPTAVDLNDFSVQEDTEIPLASLNWSPTGKCTISNGGGYGVTTIVAGANINNKFLRKEFEGKAMESPKILDTWWDNTCSGILKAEIYQDDGNTAQVFYSFNYATNSFTSLASAPDLSQTQKSAVSDQKLLFYTVQKVK